MPLCNALHAGTDREAFVRAGFQIEADAPLLRDKRVHAHAAPLTGSAYHFHPSPSRMKCVRDGSTPHVLPRFTPRGHEQHPGCRRTDEGALAPEGTDGQMRTEGRF